MNEADLRKLTDSSVTCIDASNKPNEIPTSRWLIKDEKYTIKKIVVMPNQGRIGGVKLYELNIDDCFPYSYFRLDRFGITEEQLRVLMETEEIEIEQKY